jgi:hypothetical protein
MSLYPRGSFLWTWPEKVRHVSAEPDIKKGQDVYITRSPFHQTGKFLMTTKEGLYDECAVQLDLVDPTFFTRQKTIEELFDEANRPDDEPAMRELSHAVEG